MWLFNLLRNIVLSGFFWGTLVVLWAVVSVYFSMSLWDWLRSGSTSMESGVLTMESHATTIRNVGLVAGGGVALLFAFWRSVVSERRSETERRQADTAQQGLLNERYQKGVEMLGSEILTVRLGGIYALQRLAEENPRLYHTQVVRSLWPSYAILLNRESTKA